jgi:hypothetical protein
MTSTKLEPEILKTDALGRVRTPPERRAALLEEFEKSGMSGTKFAERIGVKYQTFASWRQERRRRLAAPMQGRAGENEPVTGTTLRWVEAVLDGPTACRRQSATGLQVHLPGGAHVEIGDREQALLAAELLRALAK